MTTLIILILVLGLIVFIGLWLYERSNADHYRKMSSHHLRAADQLRETIQKLKSKEK